MQKTTCRGNDPVCRSPRYVLSRSSRSIRPWCESTKPTRIFALLILVLMICSQCARSQTINRNSISLAESSSGLYFQSHSSGNWDDYHTWDTSTCSTGPFHQSVGEVPSHNNGDGTTIQSGHIVTVAQDLQIDDTQIDGQVIVNSGKTFTLYSGRSLTLNGTLKIQGSFAKQSETSLTLNSGSLVIYNGSVAQTVVGATYADLQIDNASGASLSGSAMVSGTLTLKNGIFNISELLTFDYGASIVRQNGSLSGTPTLRYSINVTYAGTSPVTTGPELPSPPGLNNLTISNSGDVTLAGSVEVDGTLSVTSGNLVTGSNVVTLAAYSGMTETAPFEVLGMVHTSRVCTTGTTQNFGGMGMEIAQSSGYPTISVQRTTGSAPTIAGATAVKRYFDITGPIGLNATLVFHYSTTELNGANESNLKLYEQGEVPPWINVGGTINTSAHTLTLSGVNSFSLWTAAALTGPPTITGISPSFEVRGNTLDVTITGTSFVNGGSTVGFGGSGIAVNSVTWSSSTQIAANISIDPSVPTGLRSVSVTTANGTGTLPSAFEVRNPVPALTSVTPSSGTRGQSISVTLRGSGFVSGLTTVSFGDYVDVSSVTVAS
jgi:hypothetical protein